MKRIYEVEDIDKLPKFPETEAVEPNIELIPNRLRLHFHSDGVSFGLIDPIDTQFAALISFEQARKMMLEEAAKKR